MTVFSREDDVIIVFDIYTIDYVFFSELYFRIRNEIDYVFFSKLYFRIRNEYEMLVATLSM